MPHRACRSILILLLMNQDSDILAFLSKKNALLQQFLQTVQKHRSVTLFSKGRRSELKDSGNMLIGRAEGNECEAGVVAEGTWRSSTWNLRNWKLFLKNRYIRSINLYSQRLKVIEARLFPGSIVQLTRFYIVQDLTTKWLIWEMDKLINEPWNAWDSDSRHQTTFANIIFHVSLSREHRDMYKEL